MILQTEVILSDPEPKSAPEPMEQVEVIEEEIETPDLEEHTGTRQKLKHNAWLIYANQPTK